VTLSVIAPPRVRHPLRGVSDNAELGRGQREESGSETRGAHDLTLKQAALAKGVSEELFDRVVNPLALTRGGSADVPAGAQRT
jgi:hypothetical protein